MDKISAPRSEHHEHQLACFWAFLVQRSAQCPGLDTTYQSLTKWTHTHTHTHTHTPLFRGRKQAKSMVRRQMLHAPCILNAHTRLRYDSYEQQQPRSEVKYSLESSACPDSLPFLQPGRPCLKSRQNTTPGDLKVELCPVTLDSTP